MSSLYPFETSYIIEENWVGRVEYDEGDDPDFPFRLLVHVPETSRTYIHDFRNAFALDQFVDQMEDYLAGLSL